MKLHLSLIEWQHVCTLSMYILSVVAIHEHLLKFDLSGRLFFGNQTLPEGGMFWSFLFKSEILFNNNADTNFFFPVHEDAIEWQA